MIICIFDGDFSKDEQMLINETLYQNITRQ